MYDIALPTHLFLYIKELCRFLVDILLKQSVIKNIFVCVHKLYKYIIYFE